jgi:hypothetical protein
MEDNVINEVVQSGEVVGSGENAVQSPDSPQSVPPQTEDIGSLKSQWEEKEKDYSSKLSAREEELAKYKKFEEDYYTLLDNYDGSKVFANDIIKKQNEILKKFPDKDPSVIGDIISRDFNSLSDSDALVLADKLKMKSMVGVNDKDRLDGILYKLGLSDADLNALEGKDKYLFQVAVAEAKQQLSELKNTEVSDNNKFDVEAAKKARTERLEAEKTNLVNRWNPVNETLLKAFEGYKQDIKDEKGNVVFSYTHNADDKFKESYMSELADTLVQAQLEPTKENYQLVYNLINREYASRNMPKIVNDVYKQAYTKAKEEFHALSHNDSPTQQGLNQTNTSTPKGKTLKEWATEKKQ